METAKDILDRLSTDTTTKGRVKYDDAIKAMQEIADKAFDAGRDFEYVAQFGPVPNPRPDKSTFMKSLFPLKEI